MNEWRKEHPYEAAVLMMQEAIANPFAPTCLFTFAEAAAVLERLGEPLHAALAGEALEAPRERVR